MAKVKIKKIEIAAAVSECDRIIKYLQKCGVVELSENKHDDSLSFIDKSDRLSEIDGKLRTAEQAVNILSEYVKKGGLLSSLNGRTAISEKEFDTAEKNEDEIFRIAEETVKTKSEIEDSSVAAVRLRTQTEALAPWKDFSLPLNCKYTKKTAVFIGTVPLRHSREEILTALAEKIPETETVDAEIVNASDEATCIFAVCLREDSEAVEQALRTIGFAYLSDPPGVTAAQKIAELKAETEKHLKAVETGKEKLKELSEKYDKIQLLIDCLTIEKDKNEALQKVIKSKKICVISGFVAAKAGEKLKETIESKYCAAVFVTEPSDDDDVPVQLKNNGFASPLEGITEMYSMPGRDDIDPTSIMAFFYYFFFGMMLSDAGYGLIIAAATGFALLKFKNMDAKMRNNCKMYFFCGLSTVFWGAMYGSWFGDMPNIIGSNFFHTDKFSATALWMDPLSELMQLLVYCFIFGLVHLFVGVGIKAYNLWKHGKKFDAFCESIPTAVMIFGLSPIFFGLFTDIPEWLSKAGTPALILGVILVVATAGRSSKSIGGKIGGGLYGLYNLISGYLGDVLSYARLLALGLSTGVIAQVINMLCTLPSSNVLKVIMLIVVGTLGHVANLGINIIGAYVHTNRLQYVEFFGKFYEGGGRAIRPLGINTKTYKFKEEN